MTSQYNSKRLTRRELLKALAAGAGLTAMGGVLGACGAQPTEPAASEATEAPAAATEAPVAATEAPAVAEQTTITFWKSPHSQFEQERMGQVIADFEKLHPDIKVEHT